MGLTNTKEDQLRKMPIVQARVFKSKNGKFLVHKTVITDIKPLEYYKVVFEGPAAETEEVQELEV
jgi:hypothetical protein